MANFVIIVSIARIYVTKYISKMFLLLILTKMIFKFILIITNIEFLICAEIWLFKAQFYLEIHLPL